MSSKYELSFTLEYEIQKCEIQFQNNISYQKPVNIVFMRGVFCRAIVCRFCVAILLMLSSSVQVVCCDIIDVEQFCTGCALRYY